MSAQFGLYLGDERIPVINWINRHGSPEGRDLRFTVATDFKAKLEANIGKPFRIERDGKSWDFELLRVQHANTGTNGLKATGRVKVAGQPAAPKAATTAEKPATAPAAKSVEIPKPAGLAESSSGGDFKREPSKLRELLLKKKEALKQQSEAADEPSTERGLPAVEAAEEE